MIRYLLLVPLFLLLNGCAASRGAYTSSHNSALEEVRIALMDVKGACNTQQMELQLLEEKVNRLKPTNPTKTTSLESRLAQVERMLESIESDLRKLSSHANQTTQSLTQYKQQMQHLDTVCKQQSSRLDEVVKLKSTLNTISQTLATPASSGKIHKVVSGDSLDKIAKRYQTSVDKIVQINHLKNHTIFPGQELNIPE